MPIVIDPPEAPPLGSPTDDGSDFWELLYEALGFHRNLDVDLALRKFCEGLCAPAQPVHDLVREREGQKGWAILFDPDEGPASSLPHLAQYPGVVITPEMDEQQIRDEIREPTGWTRCRRPSIKLTAQRTLTGSKRVLIRTRTPSVGHYYVRTLLSETPNPARTERLLRAEVPAWEKLDYEAIDGVSWADIAAGWEDWAAVAADFESWGDLADILPDELPEP